MKRKLAVEWVLDALGRDVISERRACRVLGQVRSTQRRRMSPPADQPSLGFESLSALNETQMWDWDYPNYVWYGIRR